MHHYSKVHVIVRLELMAKTISVWASWTWLTWLAVSVRIKLSLK